MKWMIKFSRAQPRAQVKLIALSALPKSIKFYKSLGFKVSENVKKKKEREAEGTLVLVL